jgi:hypothetical protein
MLRGYLFALVLVLAPSAMAQKPNHGADPGTLESGGEFYLRQAEQWDLVAETSFGFGEVLEGVSAWRQAQRIRDDAARAGYDIFPSADTYQADAAMMSAMADVALRYGNFSDAAVISEASREALSYAQARRQQQSATQAARVESSPPTRGAPTGEPIVDGAPVGRWLGTLDWRRDGDGEISLVFSGDGSITTSDGTTGRWSQTNNEVAFEFSHGSRYRGVLVDQSRRMVGTMQHPDGDVGTFQFQHR